METSGDINVVPAPRRNSARKAVAAFADQFSGSDSGGSGDEMGSAKWNGRASDKFKYGKRTGGMKRSVLVKESATSKLGGSRAKKNTLSTGSGAVASSSTGPPAPKPRPRPRPKPKKPAVVEAVPPPVPHKEVTDDCNDDALSSDLTPLSSSESERRSSSPEVIVVNDIHPPIPTQPSPPHGISLATQLAITSNLSKKSRNEPLWSLSGLGTYVWVLIEPKSWRVFDENEHEEDGKERVWWPGKVRVQLLLSLS